MGLSNYFLGDPAFRRRMKADARRRQVQKRRVAEQAAQQLRQQTRATEQQLKQQMKIASAARKQEEKVAARHATDAWARDTVSQYGRSLTPAELSRIQLELRATDATDAQINTAMRALRLANSVPTLAQSAEKAGKGSISNG